MYILRLINKYWLIFQIGLYQQRYFVYLSTFVLFIAYATNKKKLLKQINKYLFHNHVIS